MKRHASACLAMILLTAAVTWAQSVNNPRVITISPDGTGANYSNIQAALSAITDASASNPYVILAYPGIYTGSSNGGGIRWKSYVSLRGVDRTSTIIKGSVAASQELSLFDLSALAGIEFSNITLDGSAQWAQHGGEGSGCTTVCNTTATFTGVTYLNSSSGTSESLNSGEVFSGMNCTSPGKITVRDSDMATIADFGGDWLISNSRLHATSGASGASVIAYARTHFGSSFGGTSIIAGSTLEAVGTGADLAIVNALYVNAQAPGIIHIVGSKLSAATTVTAPTHDTATVYAGGGGGGILIEGSILTYESAAGATSGEYNGIYAPPTSSNTTDVRGSVIRSVGSGGTRADVDREVSSSPINLAGVTYSTFTGVGGPPTTADFVQGQFSTDLTIPLVAPTAGSDGRMFVDSSNRLCFRSAGAVRCLVGSIFMKVTKIGTSSAPGNVVCVTAGSKRQGRAEVTIKNRDNLAVVAGAVVTGNWSGAVTQNGVTATTDASGNATFTSNQANPGGVFTFTVTNVTHAPDNYDSSANVETSDSTPTCS